MIIRTLKNKNYSTISNVGLSDNRLSLKAIGLYAYLLSKPDNWSINERGLSAKLTKDGRESVRSTLKELELCGYLVRENTRGKDGKFMPSATLHERPIEVAVDGFPAHGSTAHGKPSHIISTIQVSTIQDLTTLNGDTPVYGKTELNELFEYWKTKTGIPISSKVAMNRRACNNLFKKHGIDGVRRLVDGVTLAQSTPYAPRISDFAELQSKLSQLLVWGKQKATTKKRTIKV